MSLVMWKIIAWAAGALAFAAVVTGGIWAIYWTGREAGASAVQAKYEAEIAAARTAAHMEMQRRVSEYNQIVERAEQEAAAAARRTEEMRQKIEGYEKAVAAKPGCELTDEDIEGLQLR